MSLLYRLAQRVSQSVAPGSFWDRIARPPAEWIIRRTVGRRGLPWEINGSSCRIDPRFRAQLARNYEPGLARFFQDRVQPGQVCLDIGANIGAWVIQLARWVGPTGQVVAFEPNPEARTILELHIRLNRLGSVVRVVPAAVGAACGQVEFFAAGADGMSRIGQPNPLVEKGSNQITVPAVTLDQWCRDNRAVPDWLLIDVEGFEADVLAGAAQVIRERGAALGIVVEMHPHLWPVSGIGRDDVAARIDALGRQPVALTGQADALGEYGHVWLQPVAPCES